MDRRQSHSLFSSAFPLRLKTPFFLPFGNQFPTSQDKIFYISHGRFIIIIPQKPLIIPLCILFFPQKKGTMIKIPERTIRILLLHLLYQSDHAERIIGINIPAEKFQNRKTPHRKTIILKNPAQSIPGRLNRMVTQFHGCIFSI